MVVSSEKSSKKRLTTSEIRNRKVFHDYFVGERFEAGIVLSGPEVKSLRENHAQIEDGFVRSTRHGELFLYNINIAQYKFYTMEEYNSNRARKLLLHSNEIKKIISAMERDKSNVIPIKIYFKRGLAKVEIAICKGKKLYDKREDIKRRDALRESQKIISAISRQNRNI